MGNGDNYFTDANDLDLFMQDARAADQRVVSSKVEAKNLIDSFRSGSAASPWVSLDRGNVADRLVELVDDPRRIQQGSLNLCGPAAFLLSWNSRDPVGFVNYATVLFDTGRAAIGSMTVTPSTELITQDYAAMSQRMSLNSPEADWMTLGALRNSTDVFWQGTWTGDPDQNLSAMTRPEEITAWLQATGVYGQVRNEANWATAKGIPHATGLSLQPGTDIILLVNANLINAANGSPRDGNWLMSQFPNHYIVLLTEIVQNISTQEIQFVPWSWGTKLVSNRQSPVSQPPPPGVTLDDSNKGKYLSVPMQAFLDNYYGAIIATMIFASTIRDEK